MGDIAQPRPNGRGFRRLSLTLSLAGLAALASTIASVPSLGYTGYTVSAIVASFIAFASNLYFFLARHPMPWMGIVQASEIAAIGLVSAALSDPDSYAGMMIIALSILVFAKHRVIRRRVVMLVILAGVTVLDTVMAYFTHGAQLRLAVPMAVISVGVFAIVYYAFYDEILLLVRDVGELRQSAAASERYLLHARRDLARASVARNAAQTHAEAADERVQDLERQIGSIEAVTNPVDLGLFGLSQREIDVLRTLVETRGRNRDIGETLGITERTVKSHIYGICNKVGVDTRLELVELFRWNWSQSEQPDESTLISEPLHIVDDHGIEPAAHEPAK